MLNKRQSKGAEKSQCKLGATFFKKKGALPLSLQHSIYGHLTIPVTISFSTKLLIWI